MDRPTRPRLRRALLLAAGLAAIVGGLPAAAASAAEPWGYEQVSPVFKGAGTVSALDTFTASPDGAAIIHTAIGAFDDVPVESVPVYVRYLAYRGVDSWINRPLDPPFSLGVGVGTAVFNVQGTLAASQDLSQVMVVSKDALTAGATQGGSNLYLRDGRSGALTLIATTADPQLATVGHSAGGQVLAKFVANDGRSALFISTLRLTPESQAAPPDVSLLYAWRAGQGLTVESVLPAAEGGGVVASGPVGQASEDSEIDGILYDDALSRVYFSPQTGAAQGVYMRSGSETRAISVPRFGPAAPAAPGRVDAIVGEGRYLFFHTYGTRLTADTPTGLDHLLYRYDAVDDALTYIGSSESWTAEPVIQAAPDGQTVAFRSRLKLDPAATDFALNVYVWRKGTLRFVTTADGGSILERGGQEYLRSLSGNGRYLAFTDTSTSPAQRFGFNNVSAGCPALFVGGPGPCAVVYVFDADEADPAKRLSCASCRTDGKLPVTDAGDPTIVAYDRPPPVPGRHRFNGHQQRMVADDGTVFFTTLDGLVAEDGNGAKDAYAYRDGVLWLVSRATPGTNARFVEASRDGSTIYLTTDDAIVPTDGDRSVDLYVTRQGAGFPYKAQTRVPSCSGSDCRDPFTPIGPLALPATDMLVGSGNTVGKRRAAGAPVVAQMTTIRGATGALRVSVPTGGRIAITAPGLRRSSVTVRAKGTYRIAVALSAQARRALAQRKRLAVRATVRLTPRAGKSGSARAGLTFEVTSNSSKGR